MFTRYLCNTQAIYYNNIRICRACLNVVAHVRIVYSGQVVTYKLYTTGIIITHRTCVHNIDISTYNSLNEVYASCMSSACVESPIMT